MTSLFRVILLLIVLFGAAAAQTPAELRKFAEESVYDVWYGIYALDQKLGYYRITAEISDDGERYIVAEDMLAVSTFAGERSEDRSQLVIHYSLEDGNIVYSRAEDTGGGERLVITVEPEGQGLRLTTDTGKNRESRRIEIPKTSLSEEVRFVNWMRQAQPGDTFDSFSLDWTKEPIDTPQTFTFKSRETGLLNGITSTLYNVQEESFDLVEEAQFDQRGLPIWQKTGGMFEVKREPREIASKLDATPVEILAKTTVKSDIKLGEPPLYELVLDVSGLGDFKFPEATYQKVRYLPNGKARLAIRPPVGAPQPSPVGDREKYLKATHSLQVNSPQIQAVLSSLNLDGLSDREKVERLNQWVFNHLEKISNVNASTAISVLNNQAGDCTEHSVLLTTLLRAAGLPARELSGLVYTNDELQVFGYHAWVEVYVDGGWLAVDPTFGQVPADAGHILQSREDSLAELQIMGKMKVTVVRMRSKTKNYVYRVGDPGLAEALLAAVLGSVGFIASRFKN